MAGTSLVYNISKGKMTTLQIYYGNQPLIGIERQKGQEHSIALLPERHSHLVKDWNGMNSTERETRFHDLLKIDWKLCERIEDLIAEDTETRIPLGQIKLMDSADLPSLTQFTQADISKYEATGKSILNGGRLARATLAAGEAARFRPDPNDKRPKALFEIIEGGPTYLEVQAKDIKAAQDKYGSVIPWLLFVHPRVRKDFEKYLQNKDYFGLESEHIILVEHTGIVPKFTKDGKLALERDAIYEIKGNPVQGTKNEMVFGSSGHGFFATAYRHNPIYIQGKRYDLSPHAKFKGLGITQVFLSNIDNLGATISSHDYSIILGFHYDQASKSGIAMTVELVNPLVIRKPNGQGELWDPGGVGLHFKEGQEGKVYMRPIIADQNALPDDIKNVINNPNNPFPFNSANATSGVDAIPENVKYPDTIQERNELKQWETNLWNITRSIPVIFLVAPREIPKGLSLPPNPSKLKEEDSEEEKERKIKSYEAALSDYYKALKEGSLPETKIRSRFIPTKKWDHRAWAVAQYERLKMD